MSFVKLLSSESQVSDLALVQIARLSSQTPSDIAHAKVLLKKITDISYAALTTPIYPTNGDGAAMATKGKVVVKKKPGPKPKVSAAAESN